MRYLTAGVLSALPLLAQLPQAAWEGVVDGKVEITVRGGGMDTREVSGPAVSALKYRVYDPLPARSQQVRVQMQQGRGSVRISQQPDQGNNFTTTIAIDDSQKGSSMYAFQLFWDVTGPPANTTTSSSPGGRRYTIIDDRAPQQQQGGLIKSPSTIPQGASQSTQVGGSQNSNTAGDQYLRWTGAVDDEAIIECRQRDCYPQAQRGAKVVRDRVEYTRPLPAQDLNVNLTDMQGRGEIRLVEGPSSRNNYTTRVKIRDTQGGAGDYAFVLRWTSPAELERRSTEPGMRWTGRVDGKVRVTIEGGRTYLETLAGAPVSDERAIFDRTLPSYEGLNPAVAKRRGRGRVELVEYPSRRNNYRLVFTVEDDKGGSDLYEVEVGW